MGDRVIVQQGGPGCLIWFVLLLVAMKACSVGHAVDALRIRVNRLEARTPAEASP